MSPVMCRRRSGRSWLSCVPCDHSPVSVLARRSQVPTILRTGPYRLYFYSAEAGEPPHIHVDRERFTAKFWLDPVQLATATGFPRHELRRLRDLVEANLEVLLKAWERHHGS